MRSPRALAEDLVEEEENLNFYSAKGCIGVRSGGSGGALPPPGIRETFNFRAI